MSEGSCFGWVLNSGLCTFPYSYEYKPVATSLVVVVEVVVLVVFATSLRAGEPLAGSNPEHQGGDKFVT